MLWQKEMQAACEEGIPSDSHWKDNAFVFLGLVQQQQKCCSDAAAARLVKLSITGATQTVPPTIAPALMRRRREICMLPSPSSTTDSSGTLHTPLFPTAAPRRHQLRSAPTKGTESPLALPTTIAPRLLRPVRERDAGFLITHSGPLRALLPSDA